MQEQVSQQVNIIPKKKLLISIIVFLACVGLTFLIVFLNVKPKVLYTTINNFNKIYLAIGLIFVFLYTWLESYNIKRLLKHLNIYKSIYHCYKYAVIGFFFSGITPSSTGGQPMQIYYMHTEDVPVAYSSFALFTMLFCYQIVIGLYGIIGYVVNYKTLSQIFGSFNIWITASIIINFTIVFFIGLVIFKWQIAEKLINFIIGLFKKININFGNKIEKKLSLFLINYKACSEYLNKDINILFKILGTACIQYTLLYSIPYLVFKGLGYSGHPIITMILLQAVLYVSCGFIPTPGALAVTESLFVVIFQYNFPQEVIGNAMVISRTMSLYLPVMLYGLLSGWWLKTLPYIKKRTERTYTSIG